MTRPRLAEIDPREPATWQPTSHEYRRREALQAAAAAVKAAKDARKTQPEENA